MEGHIYFSTDNTNWEQMPDPKYNGGLVHSKNKIWNEDAGRNAAGEFMGDIVAIKYKLTIAWPPLSPEQITSIDKYAERAFFYVKFIDPKTSKYVSKRMYSGDVSYPIYSYASKKVYNGVGLDVVEK